ncbi:MAG: FKBP-type peptidyl-prolyl cis-trans isomerase [Cryomorphaceae bacterium]
MKKVIVIIGMIGCSIGAMAQKATAPKQDEMLQKQAETDQKIETVLSNQEMLINMYGSSVDLNKDIDKLSYAFGISFGESFKAQGIKGINYAALAKGVNDAMFGGEPEMSSEQAQQYLNEYIGRMMQERAAAAKKDGLAYLEKNAKRPEVKTTESGLQYEVLSEGSGAKPQATSKVTVHYEGRLLDGSVFDSSYKRGQPATFGLNQVIKGWTEGLQLMTPGSKYRLYIPSDLAYGEKGAGQMIGPGETLIFDVELLKVE